MEELNEAKEKHGGSVREAIQDMPYLEAAIHEGQRISANLVRVDKKVREDVTLKNGLKLYKERSSQLLSQFRYLRNHGTLTLQGMNIMIPIHSIMKDPKFYPEPEVYKPERFIKTPENPAPTNEITYLPFGAGPRYPSVL